VAGEIGRAFVRIVPNASGFQSSLERQTAGIGKSVGGKVGKAIGLGIGAGVAAAGVGLGVATKLAVGFDRSMRNVNSIAQLSEQSFQALNKQVLDLASASGTGPKDIADGLYDVVSSGFDAADAMKILKASTKGARAGLTSVATSTKVVTAVLNAYHLKASDASKVTDQLFQTVNVGVLSFEELSSSIGDVLPFASSLGVGLNQVGASLATMTKEGINAAESTTRIKAVMTQFLSPSKDLAARFKDLGFASGEAMIKSKGFQGALDLLAKSTHGSKAEMAKLFPDVRALGGALALTGNNSKTARADLEQLNKSVGATGRAYKEQAKSISQQWQTLVARMQVVGIKIGVRVFPLLNFGLKEATRFLNFVDKEIAKISGPTLNGKPLTFKAKAAIVWQDVQPALDAAAKTLWTEVKAGADAAFQKVTGGATVDVNVTPGIKMPVGGQTVIPVQPVLKVEDTDASGPLHTWWDNNVQPVIDDLGQTGGKSTGQSFASSFLKSVESSEAGMGKGMADQFITGPLQVLDGLLQGDAGRIGQGFKTTLTGWFHASGTSAALDLVKGIREKMRETQGIPGQWLREQGSNFNVAVAHWMESGLSAIAGKLGDWAKAGGRLASSLISGSVSRLSRMASAVWGAVSGALGAVAGHDVAGRFKKMGSGIISGIVGGLSSLVSKVSSAVTRALDAVANIDVSGLFTSVGASIISGIASGITGAVQGAISAVTGAVGSIKDAAKRAAGIKSPSQLFADEVGGPIAAGIALGITNKTPLIHKAIKASLTQAAKDALASAKQSLISDAGGVGDALSAIIDEQTRRAVEPLQKQLNARQSAASAADTARQRSDILTELQGGQKSGEADADFIARQRQLNQQLADMDRQAQDDALQHQIDNITAAGDARKKSVTDNIADLAAAFNAGKITGKQFTDALNKILKDNKATVAQAGDLLGFAFAQQFSAQLKGTTAQIAAIAAVIGMKGGGAGGAGFNVDVTNPLDSIRDQLKQAKSSLKDDQKGLRDARKTKDKKDDEREKRKIRHDEHMIRLLEGILRAAASAPGSGTINVTGSGGNFNIDEVLAEIFGGAAR
jgi:TP901 family phage tail tape measure protein